MAFDPDIANLLHAQLIGNLQRGNAVNDMANNNTAQATALAMTTAVQAGAAASQFGSDRTAIHVPATDAATNAAKVA